MVSLTHTRSIGTWGKNPVSWHAYAFIKSAVWIPLKPRCRMQSCGYGMFIPDPGSWFLPIPDPESKNSNKREGWKKNLCHTFLCSHKFHKIENYFSFEVLKKKIWANFQRIKELFTQKIVTKLWKNMGLGSGKNLFRIPDPGVKKAPDPGSWIRIRNTARMTSQ